MAAKAGLEFNAPVIDLSGTYQEFYDVRRRSISEQMHRDTGYRPLELDESYQDFDEVPEGVLRIDVEQ